MATDYCVGILVGNFISIYQGKLINSCFSYSAQEKHVAPKNRRIGSKGKQNCKAKFMSEASRQLGIASVDEPKKIFETN